ncbi:MAG: hypothetical protein K2Q22_11315 [Cytophagales bacterium]|nr:hypothetical protein [Cytophagales bacterium]
MKNFNKVTVIALAVLFAALNGQAQETFKVLASRGTNSFLVNGASSKLVTGTKLNNGATVTVGENSYVGLVHKSGKSVELKKAGTFAINDLEKQVTASSSSASKKYADFVMNELSKGGTKDYHSNMSVTGSVERGSDDELLKAVCPNSTDILNQTFKLSWLPVEGAKSYVLSISNMFEEEILKMETIDNIAVIDLSRINLNGQKAIIWSVSVKEKPEIKSGNHALKFLEPNKQVELKTSLTEIKKELGDESALNKIILAGFYEKNNLYVDAIDSYKEAIKLEPDVQEYKDAYNSFLARVGLSNCIEAQTAAK